MRVLSKTGNPNFAEVFVAQVRNDPRALIEFVDAVDPRYPRKEKWVIIVSTQIGCPVGCLTCDSGAHFLGNLTKEEMLGQIEYVFGEDFGLRISDCELPLTPARIASRSVAGGPTLSPPATTALAGKKGRGKGEGEIRNPKFAIRNLCNHPKLKIQFARMGEPALNPAVLDVLEELPVRWPIKGLMPCISTVAPVSSNGWFDRLPDIKDRLYRGGRFQLQFSINSTDDAVRNKLMPIQKWCLEEIADYGGRFYQLGDRKVTLNFALARDIPLDVGILRKHFDPQRFLVKITPVNPTDEAGKNSIATVVSTKEPTAVDEIAAKLEGAGFETIISIGAPEEIAIGSNCGQSVRRHGKTSPFVPQNFA